MADDLLYAFAGIADGLEKTSNNLLNLSIAKHEMKQKNELFGLQKKKAELDIKEAEMIGFDPEIIAAKKEQIKNEAALKKAEFTLTNTKIDEANRKLISEQQQLEFQKGILATIASGGNLGYGIETKIGDTTIKTDTPSQINDKRNQKSAALTAIKSRKIYNSKTGDFQSIKSNDELKAYLTDKFDGKIDFADPDIQTALEESIPEPTERKNFVESLIGKVKEMLPKKEQFKTGQVVNLKGGGQGVVQGYKNGKVIIAPK